jgi:hypothetical protein
MNKPERWSSKSLTNVFTLILTQLNNFKRYENNTHLSTICDNR